MSIVKKNFAVMVTEKRSTILYTTYQFYQISAYIHVHILWKWNLTCPLKHFNEINIISKLSWDKDNLQTEYVRKNYKVDKFSCG